MAHWSLVLLVGTACGRLNYDPERVVDAPSANDVPRDDDAGLVCTESPCRLVQPQCGCGTGLACQRTGATTDERACIAAGAVPADGTCAGDLECTAGHACIAQSTTSGRCHAYCTADTHCAPGLSCARLTEGTGTASPTGFCGSACTLAGGCPGSSACKVVLALDVDSAGPVAVPLCAAPTGVGSGAGCSSSLDCAPGMFCDEQSICRPFCRFDGTLTCATGSCTNPLAPIVLGEVAHGYCR